MHLLVNMTERITIKDISKKLKIHHSTVSRALRNSPQVKEETKKRIVKYAKKHGYKVNMNALKLRGTVKNVIAVIVPNINHDFFANIISVISDMASNKGFIVSVFQTNESVELEKKVLNSVIQNNVAGVIASVSMETVQAKHFKELSNYKIPLVMFDRVIDDLDVPKVEVDNFEIVTRSVEKLYSEGYDRIVHITGSDKVSVFRNRKKGYDHMIKKLGIKYHNSFSIEKGFTAEEGKLAAKSIFKEKGKPNAIICDSHILMIGLLTQLKKMDIQVPKDVKIISFSNNPLLKIFTPYISFISQPITEIGKTSFDLLVNKIQDENKIQNENKMFKAKLI